MPGPLHGLKVVDASHGTTGPRLTGFLADYGADVVWVERPGGDPLRRRQPAAASVFNRGKRSVVADLGDPAQLGAVLGLVDDADVWVESWRPGVAARLGVGYDALHARNPGLVYCSISGFGQDGPHRDVPGYESLVHALVGTMDAQPGHRDPPIYQGLPFASIGAAYLGLIGVLAALLRRHDDGFGRYVETSLLDGALAYHAMLWGESDASAGQPGIRLTNSRQATAGLRIVTRSFLCADDQYIGIHTGAIGAFGRLMVVLGLDDRIPPSETGMDLGLPLTPEQGDLLESQIHGIFASQPRQHWVDRLLEADVCAVEHLHACEVFDQPQARHNEMVLSIDDPVLGPVEQVAPPAKLAGHDPNAPAPAPLVGADTAALLGRSTGGPAAGAGDDTAAGAGDDTAAVAGHESAGRPVADTRPLLDGLKVLDLGAYYAGPYSSRLLADFGADVVKVEPVRGDQLRGLERPFFSAQAGKRSLAADLKEPGLAPALRGLLQWADVVHHNLRPGAAERLGLDVESAHAVNPGLVYLYAPGWGSQGPHRLRQSFAPMLSGFAGVTFEVAGRYNEPMPPVGNEDPGNGLLGAVAVIMALLVRRRDGRGTYVENPQLNATMGHMAHTVRTAAGAVVGADTLDTLQHGVGALDRLYETADGWVCLAARTDAHVAALGGVLGLDLAGDDRFAREDDRAANDDALADLLTEAISGRTSDGLLADLEAAGVAAVRPSGPNARHVMTDPDYRRSGRVAEVPHAEKGNVRELALLVRVSDAEVRPHRAAPLLGEHTGEVLRAVGYDEETITALRAKGALA